MDVALLPHGGVKVVLNADRLDYLIYITDGCVVVLGDFQIAAFLAVDGHHR